MSSKNKIIKCPHCGWEYLPIEIFYPDSFLGNAKDITKNKNGEIVYFDGDNCDATETYVCDNCNKEFKVHSLVNFKAEKVVNTFDDDYVTKF